jgi:hypothetical protein
MTTAKKDAKKLTDAEKLAALIELAKANGWTIPKELED